MGKLKINQKGFTAVEVLLVILILAVISAAGYMVYHNDHRAKTAASTTTKTSTSNSTAATPNPYAGWKAASVPKGLTLKAPSTYTVTTFDGSGTCSGFTSATISAPQKLLTAANISAKEYSIYILRYGTQSADCGPDGFLTSGTNTHQDGFDNITSLVSTDKINSGAISGNYLSFVKDNGLAGATEAIVTSNQYNNATAFTDPGTVTVNGNTYQITVVADTGHYVQDPEPATISVDLFKTTDLYKDTLNILNSIQ